MTDLVVASLEAWDAVWRRNQHLMTGLLRIDPTLRILFAEPDVDPLHSVRQHRRPRFGRGLRAAPTMDGVEEDRLWLHESTKVLPRRLHPRRDARWARAVTRAARRLGMAHPVLWVNDPRGAQIMGDSGWPTVYDVTDDWTLADRAAAELERTTHYEDLLLKRCNEVIVCSPALEASKGARRSVTLIPNGVDAQAYALARPRPEDLPKGCIALYVGTLHRDRLDVDLCIRTAETLPAETHLVLLGPNALSPLDTAGLENAGIRILGARPSETIPSYLVHADLLLVPHVVTPFTESLDPIKAYEYAAAARPVIATPVAGFRDSSEPNVRVVDRAGFPSAVLQAFTTPAPSPQTGTLRTDLDWSGRVDAVQAVLSRITR